MRITRPLAVIAAVSLAAGLTATPAQAASTYDPAPRKSGASWLAGELTDGVVVNEQFPFDDYGLSIDFSLGLRAATMKPRLAGRIADAVAANVTSYTTYDDGTYVNVFAGNLAKATVLALANGKNPRSFGGQNLISQLEGRVAGAGPIAGRIEDDYNPVNSVDFANVIGQAYAVQGLVGGPKAGATLRFLLKQQCKAGYFRLNFTSDKSDSDQSCNGAPKAERSPDTDATAIALLALLESKGGAKAMARIDRAVDWLVAHQKADGSFGGGTSTETPNANSTGLAGYALGLVGRTKAAQKAAVWVRTRQATDPNPCSGRLAKQAGAIAYDEKSFRSAKRGGITKALSDQWRRASSQALPALRWAPRAKGRFTATAPRTVEAGDSLRIRLTGVAPGERVCVSGGDRPITYTGPRSTSVVGFIVPHLGTPAKTVTYKVWLGSRHRDVVVRLTDSTA